MFEVMNEAVAHVGLTPLKDKFSVPTAVLFPIAYVCDFIGYLRGKYIYFDFLVFYVHSKFQITKKQQ